MKENNQLQICAWYGMLGKKEDVYFLIMDSRFSQLKAQTAMHYVC